MSQAKKQILAATNLTMRFGGVTALGCTVGQGLSGISTLAIGSFLALPGFIFGAYLAMRYLETRNAPNPCS
jgi:hypothetical protein